MLTSDESFALLDSVPVGRIAFVADGAIQVFPVTFSVSATRIVFQSAIGSKLDAAEMARAVAFQADAWDEATRTGWSVLVRGPARIVADPERLAVLDDLGLEPWLGGEDMQWIEIPVADISGRRLPSTTGRRRRSVPGVETVSVSEPGFVAVDRGNRDHGTTRRIPMATVREIMTANPVIVDISDTAADIARRLETDNIGAVMVCNPERRLQGMITDRDLAIGVIGASRDPSTTTAKDLLSGREVVTIGADDSIEEAIKTMKQHAVRRLPVIDGEDVIGIVSQADLAMHADETMVGELIEIISGAPDNTGRG